MTIKMENFTLNSYGDRYIEKNTKNFIACNLMELLKYIYSWATQVQLETLTNRVELENFKLDLNLNWYLINDKSSWAQASSWLTRSPLWGSDSTWNRIYISIVWSFYFTKMQQHHQLLQFGPLISINSN